MADQNEIKQLLDDPNVTPETKQQLVRALAGAGGSEEDVRRYAEANGVEVPNDPGFWQHTGGVLLAPVTMGGSLAFNAGQEMRHGDWTVEGGEADKLVAEAKEERELGSTQKVLNETGDFSTSNELIDAGSPGLRFFEKFIPIYQEAAPLAGHGGQAPDLRGYIYKNYDEVRDIDFGKFREDAEKINKAVADLDNHQNGLGTAWNGLASWEGGAAQAANGYNGKFLNTAGTFIQDTKNAPGTIVAGVGTIQQQVKEFAQHIHDMYAEQCGGLSVDEAKKQIRMARGDISESDFSLGDWFSGIPDMLIGGAIGIVLGGPVGGIIGNFMGWADHAKEVRQRLMDEAKQKLRGLCQEFDGKKQAFDGYCQTVQMGVQTAYDTMFGQLEGQIKDQPFGQIGDPPAFGEDSGSREKVQQPGGDTPGGGTPGGGAPGGGAPGGGAPGGGVPEMPKPENPLDKDGDGKPDVPGDTDGDGKPDDLDGDGKPDGTPDSLKGEEAPETVTIKSGDNEIQVTEPDANGHVKITIDTPQSEPKTYDVDFSNNPDAAKALMGQNGGAALAGALAGATAATPAATPGGMPTGTPGTPMTGAVGGSGAGDGAIPIEAGADGKALIELDGLAVTAEVDPLTGEINLTVDDGAGTPQEYGVEFGEDNADGGVAGIPGIPDMDAAVPLPATGEPQFSTMPVDSGTAPGFTEPVTTMPAEGGASPGFTTMPAEGGASPAFTTMPAEGGAVPGFSAMPAPDSGFAPGFTEPAAASSFQDSAPRSDAAFAQPLNMNTEGTTSTSGASMFGGPSGFNGADSVLGSSPGGAESPWSSPSSNAADHGLVDTNTSQAAQPGAATLPSMQDGHSAGQPGTGQPGGMMGGGMMGGGMAGGGQQGGGGDNERSPSQWRTTGSLFDDDLSLSRVQGVLGEEGGR
ncbi:hypothetical protein ALI22I_36475 [Saccharothrix sp. ALI-22-I]|uniref:hypothetical protein n=1 Tax=Saccharothrix sp. ALI-22-I TaxID=1933778 RepID=UPI00097C0004|nr:hypothetical protein [Saccharothrix sp. ALI-22-I]ONI83922.1 hypothetical protein ALI22I_36475 [Saccharothrix sp. ALI-22-I]